MTTKTIQTTSDANQPNVRARIESARDVAGDVGGALTTGGKA